MTFYSSSQIQWYFCKHGQVLRKFFAGANRYIPSIPAGIVCVEHIMNIIHLFIFNLMPLYDMATM